MIDVLSFLTRSFRGEAKPTAPQASDNADKPSDRAWGTNPYAAFKQGRARHGFFLNDKSL